MSDERLRELERRWRETGFVEDEAAWLRERVRVGDLTQERLELAAFAGHNGAVRALTPQGPPSPLALPFSIVRALTNDDCEAIEEVSELLDTRWGRQACGWGAREVAELLLEASAECVPITVRKAHRAILAAVDDWLSCPCEEHARRCDDLVDDHFAAVEWTSPWTVVSVHEGVLNLASFPNSSAGGGAALSLRMILCMARNALMHLRETGETYPSPREDLSSGEGEEAIAKVTAAFQRGLWSHALV